MATADAAAALAAIIALLLAAVGAGGWAVAALPPGASRAERAGLVLITGLLLIGGSAFVIGQWMFRPLVVWPPLLALAGMGVWRLTRARAWWRMLPVRDEIAWMPALLVTGVVAGTMLAGLADLAGGVGHDGVSYHLLGPREWVRHGVIRPLPDVSHTAFPQTVETLFGVLLMSGASRGPGVFAGPLFLLLCLAAAGLGRRIGLGARGMWWVAALVATMPAAHGGAVTTFIDGFYAAVAIALLTVGLDVRARSGAVLFGVLAGGLMATKYTGLIAAPVIGLITMPFWPAGRRKDIALAVAVAAVVAAPPYLRTWWLEGSPIYPPPAALLDWFTPRHMSPAAARAFNDYIAERGAGLGRTVADFLWLPYRLTVWTARFHGAGGIGPALLALAPFGLWAAWRGRAARLTAVTAVWLTLAWFLTQQESRFLIHVYAIAAVFAVAGWRVVRLEGRAPAWLAAIAITLSTLVGVVTLLRAHADALHAAVSPVFAAERHRRDVPYAVALDRMNAIAPTGRVLVLDPLVPVYYLEMDWVRPFGLYGERARPDIATPADAMAALPAWGVTHVLDVRSSDDAFAVPDATPALTLLAEGTDFRIYAVR